jgi:hypothetical protein
MASEVKSRSSPAKRATDSEGCFGALFGLVSGGILLFWFTRPIEKGFEFVSYLNRHLWTNPYVLPGWYELFGSIVGFLALILYLLATGAIVILAGRWLKISVSIFVVGGCLFAFGILDAGFSALLTLAALTAPAIMTFREGLKEDRERMIMRELSKIHEMVRNQRKSDSSAVLPQQDGSTSEK